MVESLGCICSDTERDRCGMYPKKTLSSASLLSECERKRCRSLEARGCAKCESVFSMGTAATCPFLMSEQSPRTTKLFQSVYARSNKLALRQTEISQFLGDSFGNSADGTVFQQVLNAVLAAFVCGVGYLKRR